MTFTLQHKTGMLHTMLEEQLRAYTNQLADLTAHSRSSTDGDDPDILNVLIASARQRIAHTAHAHRRMAEGTDEILGAALPGHGAGE